MRRMNFFKGVVLCLLLTGAFGVRPGQACSTFVLRDNAELLLCTNFDHYSSNGLMMINQRGVGKRALVMPPRIPVEWVSQYGSITFTQMGKEFPFGGMNEAGLAIALMWLDDTRYPEQDDRPIINILQWIQYQLDNFSSVEAVLQSLDKMRFSLSRIKLHFMICDRSGNSATVEFLDRKVVCHESEALLVEVLTNDPYEKCIKFYSAYQEFDFEEQVAHTTMAHTDRFVKIAKRLEDFRSININPAREYAFDTLTSVSVGKIKGQCTAWSIVYDVKNGQIYFKTFENRNVRVVKLADFNYSLSTPSKVLDVTAALKGDVSDHFMVYSTSINRALISKTFSIYKEAGFMKEVSPTYIAVLSNYPSTLKYE